LHGEVNLTDAKIGVDLILRGAKLSSETGTALNANSIAVGMSIHLSDGFMATGSVCLIFAKIGGQLVCRGGCFNHPVFLEYAIDAEHLTTGSHVVLDGNFKAQGTVNLQHAKIGGSLNCSSGTFGRHPLESALI
jgi:hypothetical protein